MYPLVDGNLMLAAESVCDCRRRGAPQTYADFLWIIHPCVRAPNALEPVGDIKHLMGSLLKMLMRSRLRWAVCKGGV